MVLAKKLQQRYGTGGKESSSVGWKRDQREEKSLDNWEYCLADGKLVEGGGKL